MPDHTPDGVCARCSHTIRPGLPCRYCGNEDHMLPAEPSVASDAQGIRIYLYEAKHDGRTFHFWWTNPHGEDAMIPHVAHALDAASVAARREAVGDSLLGTCVGGVFGQIPLSQIADAVLKALGLGGDDA